MSGVQTGRSAVGLLNGGEIEIDVLISAEIGFAEFL